MDTNTQMTIILSIAYIVFMLWGYSKKSGVTQSDVVPEPNYGYINYFPELEMDDEEELSILNSSSSSTQVEVQMEIECATVGVIVADPWEQDVVVTPIEFEFNVTQLEYQLALPPAIEQDVVVKPVVTETTVDYDIAQYHLMLSIMNIRQLKAEAKRVKLPRYGKMTKAELLSALKVFNA